MEKFKKKFEGLVEGDDMFERDKGNVIVKLMVKVKKSGK